MTNSDTILLGSLGSLGGGSSLGGIPPRKDDERGWVSITTLMSKSCNPLNIQLKITKFFKPSKNLKTSSVHNFAFCVLSDNVHLTGSIKKERA